MWSNVIKKQCMLFSSSWILALVIHAPVARADHLAHRMGAFVNSERWQTHEPRNPQSQNSINFAHIYLMSLKIMEEY